MQCLLTVAAILATAALSVVAQPRTITVPAGGDLQTALNVAQPGDTVQLEADAVFVGNFMLPIKFGAAMITVRSSRCTDIPAGQRIAPAQDTLTATLATPNVGPVLFAPVNTHHFRFECITFTQSAGLAVDNSPGVGYAWSYNLVQLGEGSTTDSQKTMESVPHHFEFDRVVVRARDAAAMTQRGITLNSAHTFITNSRIENIKWPGVETQALGGWNGPGPYLIENNYLEAASENIIFGGAPTVIPNLVPSDITIRNNTLTKRLDWMNKGYVIKNLFEIKNARRVVFIDNQCQYSWPDGQTGWAVILNAFRDSPQNVIDDVEIARNLFRDTANGINIRGMEGDDSITRTHRINIHDNLLENVGAFNGEGKAFQLLNGTEDVTIDHNTVRGAVVTDLILQSLPAVKHVRLRFTNNLMPHGLYGIFGDGGLFGTAALDAHATEWTATRNALYAKPADPRAELYPAGNYFPASEAEAIGLPGTDGGPVGARGSLPVPTPTPTPTPTPVPTPSPSPSPTPTPSLPCAMDAPQFITVPANGIGIIAVSLNSMVPQPLPFMVKAVSNSPGQVFVYPSEWQAPMGTGTSAVVTFQVRVKRKGGRVDFSSPCPPKSTTVLIQ